VEYRGDGKALISGSGSRVGLAIDMGDKLELFLRKVRIFSNLNKF